MSIAHGMLVDAPTQIPKSPWMAKNSPKVVKRLRRIQRTPVMVEPTIIIFFGLIRSASHPMSGSAAPPVTQPIDRALGNFALVHPKYLTTGTKNTSELLIAPQIKNIVTQIAPTIIHPRRSRSVMQSLVSYRTCATRAYYPEAAGQRQTVFVKVARSPHPALHRLGRFRPSPASPWTGFWAQTWPQKTGSEDGRVLCGPT